MQHNKRDGWTVFMIRCHNSNSDLYAWIWNVRFSSQGSWVISSKISWKQMCNKEAQRHKNIGYFKLAGVFNVTMQFHAKAAMWSSRVVILT